jgi:LemA protein
METSLLILLGLVGTCLLVVVLCYNGIISRKNAVERGWAGVITQERQKNKILPELEKVVKEHKEFEPSVLTDITRLRSGIDGLSDNAIETGKLKDIEKQAAAVIKGIQVSMEAYPDLKTSGLMEKLMREISEQQENVGAAIRIFNQNVEMFNSGIEVFPNNIVNTLLNKEKKINIFDDKEASAGFDYKPNFYHFYVVSKMMPLAIG